MKIRGANTFKKKKKRNMIWERDNGSCVCVCVCVLRQWKLYNIVNVICATELYA